MGRRGKVFRSFFPPSSIHSPNSVCAQLPSFLDDNRPFTLPPNSILPHCGLSLHSYRSLALQNFNSEILDNVYSSTIIFTSSPLSLETHSAQANLQVCKHQDILVHRVSHYEPSKDIRIPRQTSVARHVFVNHVSCARFHEAQQAQC